MSGLFEKSRRQIDENWHDTFDQLTGQGHAPSSVLATIEYVTTERTQEDVSDEFNVSEVTIRNLQAAVVALGPVDSVTAGGHAAYSKMDYCNHLADRLGWEEGVEYTVSKAYSSDTPSPSLRKEGWHSLYETICEEETDRSGRAEQ